MTAPGRSRQTAKRPAIIQRQRRLLKKYRKRMKQLQYKIEYQQYLLLKARLEKMERAYDDRPRKSMLPALSRLHKRMVDKRVQLFPETDLNILKQFERP